MKRLAISVVVYDDDGDLDAHAIITGAFPSGGETDPKPFEPDAAMTLAGRFSRGGPAFFAKFLSGVLEDCMTKGKVTFS